MVVRVVAVFDVMTHRSHATVILENFLNPYPFRGELVDCSSEIKIVAMCADSTTYASKKGDPAKRVNFAAETSQAYGIPLFSTIEQAMCVGGDTLAVDAVLSIGEGGGADLYGLTELGVPKYPRKRFFDEAVAVMRRAGRYIPLFNDKHLSYSWDHAQAMVSEARTNGFALMAGSSIVLADRKPQLGADLDAGGAMGPEDEAIAIHGGPVESYDFHGCELMQCIVENRRGGESGVRSVRLVEGAALWHAVDSGRINEALVIAAMQREDAIEGTDTASQWRSLRPTTSKFLPVGTHTSGKPDSTPHAVLLDYEDGFRGTVLRIGDDNARWNFACTVRGEIRSTRVVVGPWRNRFAFKAFSHAIQAFVRDKTPPYAVERTLLVTGVLEAAMRSRAAGGVSLDTPHLCFGYTNENLEPWRENGATWELLAPEVGYDQPMFMDERWGAWVEPPSRIARLSDYRLRGGGAHKL